MAIEPGQRAGGIVTVAEDFASTSAPTADRAKQEAAFLRRSEASRQVKEEFADLLAKESSPESRTIILGRLVDQRMKQIEAQEAAAQQKAAAGASAVKEAGPAPKLMDEVAWMEWRSKTYSSEVHGTFNSEFYAELTRALKNRSADPAAREVQEQELKRIYQGTLFQMYCNQYPDRSPAEFHDNVQGWLDECWTKVHDQAMKFASQP
jgi:hypothetical protein